jgi:hypothetical protein
MRILRLNGPAPHGVCSSAIHLDAVIPDEAKLTSGVLTRPGRSCKFFTDMTLCIGCKACEVACKEWNNLQAETLVLTGDSLTTLAPFPRCVSPNQADGGDKSWTVLRLPAWRSSLPPSSSDHAQQRASVRSVPSPRDIAGWAVPFDLFIAAGLLSRHAQIISQLAVGAALAGLLLMRIGAIRDGDNQRNGRTSACGSLNRITCETASLSNAAVAVRQTKWGGASSPVVNLIAIALSSVQSRL